VGPRPEELKARQRRLEQAQHWYDQARRDLARAQRCLDDDLARLEGVIGQQEAEVDFAADVYARGRSLLGKGAISGEQYREAEKKWRVSSSQLEQARAQRRARKEEGTREAEAELGRRQKELTEAKLALSLVECGSRPEEIEAQRAHLTRVNEELG